MTDAEIKQAILRVLSEAKGTPLTVGEIWKQAGETFDEYQGVLIYHLWQLADTDRIVITHDYRFRHSSWSRTGDYKGP